jgi:hypothetical protein
MKKMHVYNLNTLTNYNNNAKHKKFNLTPPHLLESFIQEF